MKEKEETLAEKVETAKRLYLDRACKNKDGTDWDLNQEGGELEAEIHEALVSGQSLDNEILDYCLRNFPRTFEEKDYEIIYSRTSSFDAVGAVLGFLDEVKMMKGQPIIFYENEKLVSQGKISESFFRDGNLYVALNENQEVNVPPDVLKFVSVPVNWELSVVSREIGRSTRYSGGDSYKEFEIYLGETKR